MFQIFQNCINKWDLDWKKRIIGQFSPAHKLSGWLFYKFRGQSILFLTVWISKNVNWFLFGLSSQVYTVHYSFYSFKVEVEYHYKLIPYGTKHKWSLTVNLYSWENTRQVVKNLNLCCPEDISKETCDSLLQTHKTNTKPFFMLCIYC